MVRLEALSAVSVDHLPLPSKLHLQLNYLCNVQPSAIAGDDAEAPRQRHAEVVAQGQSCDMFSRLRLPASSARGLACNGRNAALFDVVALPLD